MTQIPRRKNRVAPDEGQAYTAAVMEEVKRRRNELHWSAEKLADEMKAVGVPWTRDTVVNLENGRRQRIAAHEVIALAWVLDAGSPVDLLVPDDRRGVAFAVVPNQLVDRAAVRAWFEGKTGPLRQWLQPTAEEEPKYAEQVAALVATGMDRALAEQLIQMGMSTAARRLEGGA